MWWGSKDLQRLVIFKNKSCFEIAFFLTLPFPVNLCENNFGFGKFMLHLEVAFVCLDICATVLSLMTLIELNITCVLGGKMREMTRPER